MEDMRALTLPVPARAPLLARAGVLASVRPCLQARLYTVGLQLPVFLSLLVAWPAWCVKSRLKLSLSSIRVFAVEFSLITVPGASARCHFV